MVKEENIKSNLRARNITWLVLIVAIIALVNFISSFIFTRFDLTSDKRYTLSQASKKLLGNLEDVIYVKVYLSGDFPPAFKKLENASREMLDEMRIYAKDNLQYEFIDPSAIEDPKQRNELYQQLARKGIIPTNLREKNKESKSEKIIFPGAIMNYRSNEQAVQLLKDQIGAIPEQMLNNSIQNLEFEFSNSFKKITSVSRPKIAMIDGHGELSRNYVEDIVSSLKNAYTVERVKINSELDALNGFKTIIVAKPDTAFDEKDKFIIDQFIMNGGNVLWLIDPMFADMDSLSKTDVILAIANELNLGDMLFRYGARINYDLVQDLVAAPIPVVTGNIGNKPQQSFLPWYYFPLVIPSSTHPVVNNLNAVRFQFASSIDTTGANEVKKTVLLHSSKYSKTYNAPVRISLELMRKEPDVSLYNEPDRMLAVLFEGKFQSVFKNRIPPAIAENPDIGFKEESTPAKMIVVSDGDIIRNDYRKSSQMALPLGYDRYTGETYGNKNFLLNAIDYLSDDSGLITIRSKELKLRILDKALLAEKQSTWQMIVTAGPILIILLFGIIKSFLRKRKFAN